MTNLCARNVLRHCAEVAKALPVLHYRDCILCNVICGWKIIPRKQSMLTKLKELAECHQTFSPLRWGLGTRLAWEQGWYNAMIQIRRTAWEFTERHQTLSPLRWGLWARD